MRKIIFVLSIGVAICLAAGSAWAQPFTVPMGTDSYDSVPDAVPTPKDDNDNLAGVPDPADINDAINFLLGTFYADNEDVDFLQFTGANALWRDFSSEDNSGTFIAISLTAANTNQLGIYKVPGGPDIPLLPVPGGFSGFGYLGVGDFVGPPLPAAYSPLAPGDNFGFWIKSTSGSGTTRWDSDPTANAGGYDHMLVYHLKALSGKTVQIGLGCTQSIPKDLSSVTCTSTASYTFHNPFLIAWEDKPYNAVTGKLGDEDYDDIIYLVDRVLPVPEPMSVWLLGSGLLAGFSGLRRKLS